MVTMPRSARLAAWANAWLRSESSMDDVLTRVCGDDEPHDVAGLPGDATTSSLVTALSKLRDRGAGSFRVVLPVPGDPAGLGGPRQLTEAAIDAGEAVLAHGAGLALVPEIQAFGPPGDEGHLVTWRCYEAEIPPLGATLAEAEQQLASTLIDAGSSLAALDVASWRPEVATLLNDVRKSQIAEPLPRTYPPRAQMVAARSIRLLAVAGFALDDDGGAVSAAAAQSRRDVLAPLERAARHALVAACNSLDQ
ncbi:hypothetical protein G1H11_01505 [Phytoactinopolyspora alkaliphila]|uniref:Uncharacterized protein n=1 Tax=Phytoactinopolyspora alkaliphila TaxID=1783498 RepID=A0A6N9YGI4_9ACTN|nr:hypothetical protein [Phytoactinopolyspora alkaliphila]NED93989.1 hypothetical protein [Phytoactinopolyspora alkaliphila]